MTVLVLDRVWINRLDTGEAISARTDPDRTQTFERGLDVREYANGRMRAVSTGGERGEIPLRIVAIDQATKDLLRTWAGLAVQVRDHRGQRWFGTFKGVSVGEYAEPGLYSAGFALQLLTVVEGV